MTATGVLIRGVAINYPTGACIHKIKEKGTGTFAHLGTAVALTHMHSSIHAYITAKTTETSVYAHC